MTFQIQKDNRNRVISLLYLLWLRWPPSMLIRMTRRVIIWDYRMEHVGVVVNLCW